MGTLNCTNDNILEDLTELRRGVFRIKKGKLKLIEKREDYLVEELFYLQKLKTIFKARLTEDNSKLDENMFYLSEYQFDTSSVANKVDKGTELEVDYKPNEVFRFNNFPSVKKEKTNNKRPKNAGKNLRAIGAPPPSKGKSSTDNFSLKRSKRDNNVKKIKCDKSSSTADYKLEFTEEPQPKNYMNLLYPEAKWMLADFLSERNWKKSMAKLISYEIKDVVEAKRNMLARNKAQEKERQKSEESLREPIYKPTNYEKLETTNKHNVIEDINEVYQGQVFKNDMFENTLSEVNTSVFL